MLENSNFKTGVDYYHRLNFVFNLMIAVPLLPFSLLYLGSVKGIVHTFVLTPKVNLIIDFITTSLVVALSYYAIREYRYQRAGIVPQSGLRNKMIHFHNCLIRMYLILMGSSCISVFGYLLTYSKIHIIAFVALLVLFSLKRPSLKMIVEQLRLEKEESEILRHRKPIL